MAIVIIGGQAKRVGKTSVVCALVSAMPERHWTAIKITQSDHGVFSANGEPGDCETADHTLAISEERDATADSDSSRYLAAGAVRSLWLRTRRGQLEAAMPWIRAEIARSGNIILESNSALRFLKPDIYASVLDPKLADFKPSALRYLDRADAILMPAQTGLEPAWSGVSLRVIAGKRQFRIAPPSYSSAAFVAFVAQKLEATGSMADCEMLEGSDC